MKRNEWQVTDVLMVLVTCWYRVVQSSVTLPTLEEERQRRLCTATTRALHGCHTTTSRPPRQPTLGTQAAKIFLGWANKVCECGMAVREGGTIRQRTRKQNTEISSGHECKQHRSSVQMADKRSTAHDVHSTPNAASVFTQHMGYYTRQEGTVASYTPVYRGKKSKVKVLHIIT
ncbi:hypothetical protein E2C01_029878 [Portunus trituberculatus]|uniref:Secreted protein n=1 Tax=Portunus trituberculatus TaxID=210409 RepID=A0A5B7EPH0_PORTR|nr:hypothetical protein [Portunus trituberculatus]